MKRIEYFMMAAINFRLFCGYNKLLRVFDIHRPGREFEQYSTLTSTKDGQTGIISCLSFSSAHNGLLAAGSYNRTTALFAEDNAELLFVLHGQEGGVTQVLFSRDGNYLYTGGRKDPYILCWDVRNTAGILYKLYRSAENTNQRIAFDIESYGRHLGTGGQDGRVNVYDLQTGEWVTNFQASFVEENCASVWNFSCTWVGYGSDGNHHDNSKDDASIDACIQGKSSDLEPVEMENAI